VYWIELDPTTNIRAHGPVGSTGFNIPSSTYYNEHVSREKGPSQKSNFEASNSILLKKDLSRYMVKEGRLHLLDLIRLNLICFWQLSCFDLRR
jgi:hypothetical protein